MKKILTCLTAAAIMFSCCACAGRTDDGDKQKDKGVAVEACWYEAIFGNGGSLAFRNDSAPKIRHDMDEEVELRLDHTYYLQVARCTAKYYPDVDEYADIKYEPPVECADGAVVREPKIEYDSEYLNIKSASNPISCCYIVTCKKFCGINSSERTQVKVASETGDVYLTLTIRIR